MKKPVDAPSSIELITEAIREGWKIQIKPNGSRCEVTGSAWVRSPTRGTAWRQEFTTSCPLDNPEMAIDAVVADCLMCGLELVPPDECRDWRG